MHGNATPDKEEHKIEATMHAAPAPAAAAAAAAAPATVPGGVHGLLLSDIRRVKREKAKAGGAGDSM